MPRRSHPDCRAIVLAIAAIVAAIIIGGGLLDWAVILCGRAALSFRSLKRWAQIGLACLSAGVVAVFVLAGSVAGATLLFWLAIG